MRKIILIFVTIVLPCLLCARNDDKSTDMLLREIDGIIRNRQTYGAEKEARISDLKKLLSEATSGGEEGGHVRRMSICPKALGLTTTINKQSIPENSGLPWKLPCRASRCL